MPNDVQRPPSIFRTFYYKVLDNKIYMYYIIYCIFYFQGISCNKNITI